MKITATGLFRTKNILIAVIIICFSTNAWAYLDPGTGSYIFQIVAAAVLGSFFALKMYWKRIVSFFKNRKNREDSEQ